MNVAQDIFVRPPPLCVPKLLVRAHEVIGRADVRYWPKADIGLNPDAAFQLGGGQLRRYKVINFDQFYRSTPSCFRSQGSHREADLSFGNFVIFSNFDALRALL